DVRLNTDATRSLILELHPQAVVIATGSRPTRLSIPGGPSALTVHEVVAGAADKFSHVVVFDREGFHRALVAADYVSARGTIVEFVTPLPQACGTVEIMMLDEMIERLEERDVRFHPGQTIDQWDGGGSLRLRSVQTSEEMKIDRV